MRGVDEPERAHADRVHLLHEQAEGRQLAGPGIVDNSRGLAAMLALTLLAERVARPGASYQAWRDSARAVVAWRARLSGGSTSLGVLALCASWWVG